MVWIIVTACTPPLPELEQYEGTSFSVVHPAGEVEEIHRDRVVFDGVRPTQRFSEGWWVAVTTDRAARFGQAEEGLQLDGGSGGVVYRLVTRYPTWELVVDKHVPEAAWPPYRGQMGRELEHLASTIAEAYRPHPIPPDEPRFTALLDAMRKAESTPHTLQVRVALAPGQSHQLPTEVCTAAITAERTAVRCSVAKGSPDHLQDARRALGRGFVGAFNHLEEMTGPRDGDVSVRAVGHGGDAWQLTVHRPSLVVRQAKRGDSSWVSEGATTGGYAERGVVLKGGVPSLVVTLLDYQPRVDLAWMEEVRSTVVGP